jgi:hypothetical protein
MPFLRLKDLAPFRKEANLFSTAKSQGGSEQLVSDGENIVGTLEGI